MLNRVVLIGRLTRDPELRYTPNDIAICTFTLAIDRKFAKEGQQQADFIMCQVWRKQAENVAKYLSKGKMAGVDGTLQIDNYEKDGERKWITKVVADNVRFLSPKSEDAGQDDFISGEIDEDPDDLPF